MAHPALCNLDLLRRSLICGTRRTSGNAAIDGQPLTSQEEEALAEHLNQCESCRDQLELMAADAEQWTSIRRTLLKESSSGHPRLPAGPSNLSTHSGADDHDLLETGLLKPSDFIVEFLQPSDHADSIGRLGSIEIRQFIGQGAHGVVLKGYQPELNRLVAVKVLAPHLASVVAARKRFAREARATAAIVHPNVMPILAVDSSGPLPFLVMPCVDCESLQDRLDREGGLSLEDLLRISIQVARGLAAAHAQGLVHRDVKPANILLERGVERVMLTDFGLARTVDDATLTRSGLIAGTPHYMSPEQARGDVVDARSDLFSLGSVLYCMVTGRPPFRAETTFGILRRVTDEEPRPLRELRSEMPQWLETIVTRLLRKSSTERFDSADQLASILEDCLAHLQQPATSPLPPGLVPLQARSWTSLLSGSLLAGFALLAMTLVSGVYLISKYAAGPASSDTDTAGQKSASKEPVQTTAKDPEPVAIDDHNKAAIAEDLRLDVEIEAILHETNSEFDALQEAMEADSFDSNSPTSAPELQNP